MPARLPDTFLNYDLEILGMAYRADLKHETIAFMQCVRVLRNGDSLRSRGAITKAFRRMKKLGLMCFIEEPAETRHGSSIIKHFSITDEGKKAYECDMEAFLGAPAWKAARIELHSGV